MDASKVKLFDANNKFVPNFDEEIERILISIYGPNYYDIDIDFEDTRVIKTEEIKKELKKEVVEKRIDEPIRKKEENIKRSVENNKKIKFKDFIPVLFFMIIFAIILVAGYYFLNTIDLMELIR